MPSLARMILFPDVITSPKTTVVALVGLSDGEDRDLSFITARCTAKRGLAIACRLSVRLSGTLVDHVVTTTQVGNIGN